MKILLTGPNGFVGKYIMKVVPEAEPIENLRSRRAEIPALFEAANVIIHTAAISNTRICEENPDDSYDANVLFPVEIAKAAPNAKLICFSSDQVYNASPLDGPYSEDMSCPAGIYANHKLEMEQRVLDINPDAVMLRAAWMYDMNHGFIKNLLQADSSIEAPEQYRGITWVQEVADSIRDTFTLPGGCYNFGSENGMPMPVFTEAVLRLLNKDVDVVPGNIRHNLWMNTEKAQKHGISFSSSLEGVRKCIHQI